MSCLAGIDIGGTKCAVSLGQIKEDTLVVLEKRQFTTPRGVEPTITGLMDELAGLLADYQTERPAAIGISCGGPLDSRRGLLLSPPNLPGFDRVDIVTPFRERYGVPVKLQNDANSGALAEWKWGAGRGTRNMVFLTFGTGMGAGLILNGQLYTGTNDMAGEIGHITMGEFGPAGYGKVGSFEGFCSGSGIAQLAQTHALAALQSGRQLSFCGSYEEMNGMTAEKVGMAALHGDADAMAIIRMAGRQLGRGLSFIVDILNPEKIIIGSIYHRQRSLLEPEVMDVLKREALAHSLSVCTIVPSQLGEQVGDYASLTVAYMELTERMSSE
ncbi:ROK family protein [Paenibacillus sp. strain BS8-2]